MYILKYLIVQYKPLKFSSEFHLKQERKRYYFKKHSTEINTLFKALPLHIKCILRSYYYKMATRQS